MDKSVHVEWSIETMKVADLRPAEANERKISKKARKALENSLKRFGCVELPVWNKRTGRLVGGHQRVDILSDNGVVYTPVIVVDMDEEEAVLANLVLNNKAIMGEFDDPAGDLLADMKANNPEIFSDMLFDQLLKKIDPDLAGANAPENSKADTKCPFCDHEWAIQSDDVFMRNLVPKGSRTSGDGDGNPA